MLIAIDFDNTLTADHQLWATFIESAKSLEHRVICITSRRDTEVDNETIDEWMELHGIQLPIYFTALSSKVEHAKKIGLKVDIWIDDEPKRCALGH